MTYLFPPQPVVTLSVQDTDALFPVHRIFCVGRNYAAHAREMGHDPEREPPFFFQKNADCLVDDGRFPYPRGAAEVHHEIELAVALQAGGANIARDQALAGVFGYAVALDMTRRDLQAEAKKFGRPWDVAKAFAASAPCGPIAPASRIGHPASGAITLDVNGIRRQSSDLSHMIWPVADLIARLSDFFTLAPGDLIFTGTPDGVGPVQPGDCMIGDIAGVGSLRVEVVET